MARVNIEQLEKLYEDLWGTYSPDKPYKYRGTVYLFFEPGHLRDLFPEILEDYILSRDEYKQAYITIEDAHQQILNGISKARSLGFILTGQPGIGKSTFLAYVLKERLQRKLPTAVELPGNGKKYVLFSNAGVEVYDDDDTPEKGDAADLANVWALSDSTSAYPSPCHAFRASKAVIIQATSPAKHRWNNWKKTRNACIYLMDVWTPGEIGAVLYVLVYNSRNPCVALNFELNPPSEKMGLDVTRGEQLIAKYGPCARTIISLVEKPTEEGIVEKAISAAVQKVVANVSVAISALGVLDMASHDNLPYLFFIRPKSKEIRAGWQTYIPTMHMVTILAEAIVAKSTEEQTSLFRDLSMEPETQSAAGCLFENVMHARFTTVGGGPIYCFDNLGRVTEIKIPTANHLVAGTLGQLETSSPPFYWRPGTHKFPGVDSILSAADILWVFQANIGHRHGDGVANEGLRLLARHLGSEAVERMRLVIVGSDLEDTRSIVDSMVDIWENVPAYACQLDFALSESMVNNFQAQVEGTQFYNCSFMDIDGEEVMSKHEKEAGDEQKGDESLLISLSGKNKCDQANTKVGSSSTKRKAPGLAATTRSTRQKTESSNVIETDKAEGISGRTLRRRKR
ncbi:hypothetical protein BC835DRAFT_1416774 [Cytidiella melzeri]|nr:hypothetical protein BC835DRAFT_1416774 [Cytidiella melzeri]